MTVREYIDKFFTKNRTQKSIRIMDAITRRGMNQHWLLFEDLTVIETKVTDKYLFIFI